MCHSYILPQSSKRDETHQIQPGCASSFPFREKYPLFDEKDIFFFFVSNIFYILTIFWKIFFLKSCGEAQKKAAVLIKTPGLRCAPVRGSLSRAAAQQTLHDASKHAEWGDALPLGSFKIKVKKLITFLFFFLLQFCTFYSTFIWQL